MPGKDQYGGKSITSLLMLAPFKLFKIPRIVKQNQDYKAVTLSLQNNVSYIKIQAKLLIFKATPI